MTSGGGGPETGAAHRSVVDELITIRSSLSAVDCSCVQLRQPAQGGQSGREEVLPAARLDEGRQVGEPATDRAHGNREGARLVLRSDEWVLLERGADEDAVV